MTLHHHQLSRTFRFLDRLPEPLSWKPREPDAPQVLLTQLLLRAHRDWDSGSPVRLPCSAWCLNTESSSSLGLTGISIYYLHELQGASSLTHRGVTAPSEDLQRTLGTRLPVPQVRKHIWQKGTVYHPQGHTSVESEMGTELWSLGLPGHLSSSSYCSANWAPFHLHVQV